MRWTRVACYVLRLLRPLDCVRMFACFLLSIKKVNQFYFWPSASNDTYNICPVLFAYFQPVPISREVFLALWACEWSWIQNGESGERGFLQNKWSWCDVQPWRDIKIECHGQTIFCGSESRALNSRVLHSIGLPRHFKIWCKSGWLTYVKWNIFIWIDLSSRRHFCIRLKD